jgi:hypothetical protein
MVSMLYTGTSIGADNKGFIEFRNPNENVPIEIFFVQGFMANRTIKDFGR